MFCPNCGKQIKDYDNFCRYCGTDLRNEVQMPEPVRHAEIQEHTDKEEYKLPADDAEEFVLYDVKKHWMALFWPVILTPVFFIYFWTVLSVGIIVWKKFSVWSLIEAESASFL